MHLTTAQRARAADRAAAVRDARLGGLDCAHLELIAARYGVAVTTLRRWLRESGDSGMVFDRARSGRPPAVWDGDGAQQAWELWAADYLRLEKPTAAECTRRIVRLARVRGWEIPRYEKAFLRRLRAEFSEAEIVRAREGVMPLLEMLPAQQRSVAALAPLDIINGDGKRHDVLVDFPSGARARPVVWYWQDVRTRKILAWHGGESESAELVRLSLHKLVCEFGVPGRVLVDSTRAAANRWLTGGQGARRRWKSSKEEVPGILHALGIGYSVTAIDRDAAGRGKGRGRSKPIERAFADFAHYIDTHPRAAGAYTGRSPADRPETHRSRAISWAEFLALVDEGVCEYNAREGRRTEAAAGRSFDATFAEEFAQTTVRHLSAAQAAMLLLAVESSKVKRDGTLALRAGRGAGLPANRYHHADLIARAGESLVVRFDPEKLHEQVHIYDSAGRYICAANCLLPVGFADANAAREHARQRRRFQKSAQAGVAARERMDELTAALDDARPAPPPAAKPAALRLVTDAAQTPARANAGAAKKRRAVLLRGLGKVAGGE